MGPRRPSPSPTGRRLPVAVAIVVLTVACQATVETTTSTIETIASPATSTTTAATSITVAAQPDSPDEAVPDPGRVLRMGLVYDMGTQNSWDHSCRSGNDIDAAVRGSTRLSLYGLAMPGINIVPDLAADPQPPQPRPDGDGWVVEVSLRQDAIWSDGEPITADDVVFTFDLAAEIGLGCTDYVEADSPRTGVLGVEIVGEHAVRIKFNDEPGLGVWPHGIGMAPIMAEHYWAPYVSDARSAGEAAKEAIGDPALSVWDAQRQAAEDAGEVFTKAIEEISVDEIDRYLAGVYDNAMTESLFAVPGVGDPSGGPLVYSGRTPRLGMGNAANPGDYRSGETIRSGGTTYTIGPFVDEQIFTIFASAQELVLALARGEIDHALVVSSAPALLTLLEANSDTRILTNPSNLFQYLGFNLRKPPMNDPAFRRALAMMIDRDLLTGELFQEAVPPTWTLLPEANLQYFDADAAAEIASKYRNLDRSERLETAVGILKEAGYKWEHEPAIGRSEEGEPFIEPGRGIMSPDGTPVQELEILSAGPASGLVFFASYGVFIERWLQDLGFDARAHITEWWVIAGQVWPGVGTTPTFDMYLLGWVLGNPAFPTFHDSFFHSRNLAEINDGNNAVGYINPELDQLAERLYEVTTVEEAKDIIWQLEAILDRDLPYVVLNGLTLREAVSTRLELPFAETLNGLVNLTDFPGLVRIKE